MQQSERSEYNITVDATREIKLTYYRPKGKLNWGINVDDSDLEHDVSTPLVLMLHDFPGYEFNAHGHLFDNIAQTYLKMGIPSLGVEYRGAGETAHYSGHLTLNTAMRDIEVALRWAILEDHYTKIIPVVCGLSAPIMLSFINKYNLSNTARAFTPKKEDSIHDLLAKSTELSDESMDKNIDLSDLRLISMVFFWPLLALEDSFLKDYLPSPAPPNQDAPNQDAPNQDAPNQDTSDQQVSASEHNDKALKPQNSGQKEPAAPKEKITPFKDAPQSPLIPTHKLNNEHYISVELVQQLAQMSIMDHMAKLDCPFLLQQGSSDEYFSEAPINTLRQVITSKYVDIQIFGGGSHGLKEGNMRPYVMRLMRDFIRKFI